MAKHFLGIDIGSSYTKFVVVDENGASGFTKIVPTLSRNRQDFDDVIAYISTTYAPSCTCSTGYGRKKYEGDIQKTELICAAFGVNSYFPVHKSIIDIGGEDIKIMESDEKGNIVGFHMNDKCSAGTGTFITEIAEKAELDISEMNDLAERSSSERTMNSFCTVFAKTEILGWKFNDVPVEDIARGIYLSIVDRICKLPIVAGIPLYICGGVIGYHPYLSTLLSERLEGQINVVENPQMTVALGAALFARAEIDG